MRICRNCSWPHPADKTCPPNWSARLAGEEDRRHGEMIQSGKWPPGTYGHADYMLGFWNSHRGSSAA